jgi:Cu-Zn family superoxide dismutase
MRRVFVVSCAAMALASCQGMSVGVGVGGTSGNVGVGASTTIGGGGGTTPSQREVTVSMFKIDASGIGPEIGTLTLSDSRGGLRIVPNLKGLPPGQRGSGGHAGDLPVLTVAADGTATETVHALRLSVSSVRGRAVVIHEGGDNFSDQPKPLGGGGARIACGVVSAASGEAP